MVRLFVYYFYLFFAWSGFRYFVHLPPVIEELWFKPMIWLTPLIWWNLALRKRVEMFGKRILESLTWGGGVGIVYWFALRRLSLGVSQINADVLGVAITTAVVEELVFSGFVVGYLEKIDKGSLWNVMLAAGMGTVIRLPIMSFVYNMSALQMLPALILVMATSFINAWIRQRTGNVTGSIVARTAVNLAILG